MKADLKLMMARFDDFPEEGSNKALDILIVLSPSCDSCIRIHHDRAKMKMEMKMKMKIKMKMKMKMIQTPKGSKKGSFFGIGMRKKSWLSGGAVVRRISWQTNCPKPDKKTFWCRGLRAF